LFGVAIDHVNQVTYFSSFSAGSRSRAEHLKRDADENVTLVVNLTRDVRVLGLEFARRTFGGFGSQLIATTDARIRARVRTAAHPTKAACLRSIRCRRPRRSSFR
jgi:hypothetical protein